MELSIFLAKVMGLYLVITMLAFLFNRSQLEGLIKSLLDNTFLMVFGGVMALIVGLLVVVSHNVWTADWRVLITIFGWLSVVKGLVRLFAPSHLPKWVLTNSKLLTFLIWVFLVIGIYLTYVGFSI